jgi:hypothetical protein
MRVDDAARIRPGPIGPAVEAVRRIRHARAFEHVQVLVDEQQVVGPRRRVLPHRGQTCLHPAALPMAEEHHGAATPLRTGST